MKKKTEKKEETKQVFAVEGEKIDVEACPKCKSELVVKTKGGLEYFECDNCKFVKNKKGKKEEKKESEEFPDMEIGFDPFSQQV